MESANLNEGNRFAYGTAEHLAFEMGQKFGGKLDSFTVSFCYGAFGRPDSISNYLEALLVKYGFAEAQHASNYLNSFETMPELMPSTREQITLMNLDFEVNEND